MSKVYVKVYLNTKENSGQIPFWAAQHLKDEIEGNWPEEVDHIEIGYDEK